MHTDIQQPVLTTLPIGYRLVWGMLLGLSFLNLTLLGANEMALWVKERASEWGDLTSILESTWWKQRTHSQMLSSDFHMW